MKLYAAFYFLIIASLSTTSNLYAQTVTTDFNGDGLGDILYRGQQDLTWRLDLMDGSNITSSHTDMGMSACCGWLFNGTGDFNNDGKSDVIIRNIRSGQWYIYNISDAQVINRGYVPIESAINIGVQAVADFDQDGYSDVVLRNEQTGEWSITLLQNRVIKAEISPPMSRVLNWKLVDAKDFDNNGSNDILIRNETSGAWYVYLYENTEIINRGYIPALTSDTQEQYRASGDFNGDGAFDILMRNLDTGTWSIIYMNGREPLATRQIELPSSRHWQINTVNDFDGDGISDISLLNTSTSNIHLSVWSGEQARKTYEYSTSLEADKRGVTLYEEASLDSIRENQEGSLSYFKNELVDRKLLDTCISCHISGGEAELTDLILTPVTNSDALYENYLAIGQYIEDYGIAGLLRRLEDDDHYGAQEPISEQSGGIASFFQFLTQFRDEINSDLTLPLVQIAGAGDPDEEATINFVAVNLENDAPIVTYEWDFGDGSTGEGEAVSHQYATQGHYVAQLKATADNSLIAYSSVNVYILKGRLPSLDITADQQVGERPLTVNFTSNFTDFDGDEQQAQFQWDFGDGSTSSHTAPGEISHTFNEAGTYTTTVIGRAEDGDVLRENIIIVVNDSAAIIRHNLDANVTLPEGYFTDSDNGDPQSEQIDNSTANSAQNISSVATITGFVTRFSTNQTTNEENPKIDALDAYYGTFQQGQLVELLADHNGKNPDLWLILYDSETLDIIASAEGGTTQEYLTIPQSSDYYIGVYANAGEAAYTLSTSFRAAPQINALNTQQDIAPFQALGYLKKNRNTPRLQSALANQNIKFRNLGSNLSLLTFPESNAMAQTFPASLKTQNSDLLNKILEGSWSVEKRATIAQIKQIRSEGDFEDLGFNGTATALAVNDELFSSQWHYPLINLEQAWELTPIQGDNTVVAVIDTGVNPQHPDLIGQFTTDGYDLILDPALALDGDGYDNDPLDSGYLDITIGSAYSSHGTHVAGTIGALTNNGLGGAGVAPNVKMMALRVLGKGGSGTYSDIIQGILYAAGIANDSGVVPRKSADVINMSLGGTGYSTAMQRAIDEATAAGSIIVAAAGNSGTFLNSYPAAMENVISVSALGSAGTITRYSNFGSTIDVAAPGGDTTVDLDFNGLPDGVLSTLSGANLSTGYQFLQGTSMAAPHVAGVIALMHSIDPTLTTEGFMEMLRNGELTDTNGALSNSFFYGYGMINAQKAVIAALQNSGNSNISARLVVPSAIKIQTGVTNAELIIEKTTAAALSVQRITHTGNWLSISVNNTDSEGLGTYLITVNPNNLTPGYNESQITVTDSSGKTYEILVSTSAQADSTENGASRYILVLVDPSTRKTIQGWSTNTSGNDVQFIINDALSGLYDVYVGTDNDNDNFICDNGEYCGYLNEGAIRKTLEITGNENIELTLFSVDLNNLAATSEQLSTKSQGYSYGQIQVVDLSNSSK